MSGFCFAPDASITTTFTLIVAPDATDAIVRPLHRLRVGWIRVTAKHHFACVFLTCHRLRYPQNGTFKLLHLVGGVSLLAYYVGYMQISVCRIKPE